jgi:pimeloyl-ACP methyl ester carboxylesterase
MNTHPVRRRLVALPAGHMHLREAGAGPAVLLLHWTPASSRQYAAVVPELAARGWRAVAPDHFGYGLSDPRPGRWLIADYADSVAALMDELDIDDAGVVGGHVSSEIAVELSLRHPIRVRKLVLDGSPVWSRETREQVLNVARQPPPKWSEDGAHFAWAWQRALWLQRMWEPGLVLDDAAAERLRGATLDSLLAQQSDDSADALKEYDMAAALARVSVPTLAVTATTDPLNNCHAQVMGLVKGAAGHVFEGRHPLHDPASGAAYAAVLDAFLKP